MTARYVISIPEWARIAGLAEDGQSIAVARQILGTDAAPDVAHVVQHPIPGVDLRAHRRWLRRTPWARYLASTTPRSVAAKREHTNKKGRCRH